MKNKGVVFTTQAAMIAAIYVVLTVVFAPFSFGSVQVRIAEALTILPAFTPAAIPGLFKVVLPETAGNITEDKKVRNTCNFNRCCLHLYSAQSE